MQGVTFRQHPSMDTLRLIAQVHPPKEAEGLEQVSRLAPYEPPSSDQPCRVDFISKYSEMLSERVLIAI